MREAEETDIITARLSNALILRIDKHLALLQGEPAQIDNQNKLVKPYIDGNSRALVPIRFVAEALGMDIAWHNGSRLVIIIRRRRPWDETGAAAHNSAN